MAMVDLVPAWVSGLTAPTSTPTSPLNDRALNLADGDDATYNEFAATNGLKDGFTMTRLPLTAWKINSSGDLVWRMSNAGGGTARVWWKLNGTTVNGVTRTGGASPADFTESAIARPGGGSWEPADFDALEVGFEIVAHGGAVTRIYDLLHAGVDFDEYVSAAPSVREVTDATEADPEPARFTLRMVMQSPEDFDWIDADPENILVMGSIHLPNSKQFLYVTLSQNPVVNPRT